MASVAPEVKATKAKGEKKPKAVPSHPPYIEMVSDAILSLKERDGSSLPAIKKFIEAKYGKVSTVTRYISFSSTLNMV